MTEMLWPEITPFDSNTLQVDDVHSIYYEQVGSPTGDAVVFLHGGPGAGCTPTDRRFFDPSHFRVVLFDQRGCGRSTPHGELANNTIEHLTEDIEVLREHLGIERWHVFGGSWGSTLGLYYAQAHPTSVQSLVLRGIWLLRSEEIEWWLQTLRFVLPETWEAFAAHIPADERGDLLGAYRRRLESSDPEVVRAAAINWSKYEAACCTLLPNPDFAAYFDDVDVAQCVARLETHYFATGRFEPEDLLLQRVDVIRSIPAFLVHGRYDMVCPAKNALDLARAWPEASLVVVPDAGHSSHEPGITSELVEAMNRVRDTGSPALG